MTANPLPLAVGAMAANANPIIGGVMVGAEVISIASSVMVKSITALYGTAKSINEFLNEHIKEMQNSENGTVSQTGRVLEDAKLGFGIGFSTPVVIIAAGQLILGNPLSAATVVITAPFNPIAMTCAAVGAIYYGWNVLTEQEKNEIIKKLSKGLEIGIEMIKSVIRFVTEKTEELLSEENLKELKNIIRKVAEFFGKTLGDITGKLLDCISDTFTTIRNTTGNAFDSTIETISEAADVIKAKSEVLINKMTPGKSKPIGDTILLTHVDQEDSKSSVLRVTLTSKGQLTIPAKIRNKLDLLPQSEVELVIDGSNLLLRKATSKT